MFPTRLGKRYKLAYHVDKKRYFIVQEYKMKDTTFYSAVYESWRNLLQADCKSIDDIVELSNKDVLDMSELYDRITGHPFDV